VEIFLSAFIISRRVKFFACLPEKRIKLFLFLSEKSL